VVIADFKINKLSMFMTFFAQKTAENPVEKLTI
jgi:hypothetical protein